MTPKFVRITTWKKQKSNFMTPKFVPFSCSPMRSYKVILYDEEISESEPEFKLCVMMSFMNPS